jgi:hypothetical protein
VELLTALRQSLEDPDPLVRRELLHRAAQLDDEGTRVLLSRVAESDPDERVRQTAQELLVTWSGAIHSQGAEGERRRLRRDDE